MVTKPYKTLDTTRGSTTFKVKTHTAVILLHSILIILSIQHSLIFDKNGTGNESVSEFGKRK